MSEIKLHLRVREIIRLKEDKIWLLKQNDIVEKIGSNYFIVLLL